MITIRSRLFVAFALMVLAPAIAFGAAATVVGYRAGRQQVINQLESVATIKEAELNTWVNSLQIDLATALIGKETVRYAREVLSPSGGHLAYQVAYDELHARFGQLLEQSPRFDELFLMAIPGRVVLSTDLRREGRFGAPGSQIYFQKGLQGEYLHPPSYTLSVGGSAVVAVRPILDEEGQALGILAGRAGPETLNEIMLERTGLGETGETYLVTRGHIMLTEPRFPREQLGPLYYVFTNGVNAALEEHINGSGLYNNYRDDRVIGVYRWLPELKVALLAEQSESEALAATNMTLGINLALTAVAILVAGMISLFLARSIAVPLADLAETATRVAGGELKHTATVTRPDEIGAVAQAFNIMTAQLRDLIGNLEQRVEERTQALEQRAIQLETSAQVSREIASILELDDLLNQVVELIRGAFGYYYVGIFLVDSETNTLVYRAGTGAVGRQWKRQEMRLEIGSGSLNGEAAQANEAAIANDVSQDPRYLAVELLPDTRSELVIPLRMGERAVGALDIQSAEIDTFSEDDARILQSLADQIAVAVENARLYDHSRALAVVEERNRLARELHDSVTQSLYSLVLFAGAGQEVIEGGDLRLAQQHLTRLEQTAQQALKEMRLLVYELRPLMLEQEGLLGALQRRLDAVERRARINARLFVDGDVDLPAHVEKGLYRIAQEALNNALKHAAATSITVRIGVQGEQVALEVVDDGMGFDLDSAGGTSGVGLASMRERAAGLGGILLIRSKPGKGTTVRVALTAAGDGSRDSGESSA